jgi:hypothetical protein
VPAALTTKLPGPVNVWTLKFVQTVVTVPPVAIIKSLSIAIALLFPSLTTNLL